MPQKKILVIILCCWIWAVNAFGSDFATIKGMIPSQLLLADSLSQLFYADAKAAGDSEGVARGAYLLGLTNYFQGKLYLSAKFYEEALASDYIRVDKDLAESCWNNLGIVLELQNSLSEAFEAYHKSFLIAEEKGDSFGMVQTQINLGLLELKRQNTSQGMANLKEALIFFERQEDTLNIGLCLQNIGVGFKETGNFVEAERFFLSALDRFELLDYYYGIADVLTSLGYVLTKKGEFSKAKAFLEQSRELSIVHGLRFQEAAAVGNLADLDLEQDNFMEARQKYQFALGVFEELKVYDQWEITYWGLLQTAVAEGNPSLYGAILEEFQNATRKRISEESLARYDELKAVYEMEEKVRQIQYQQAEIQGNRRKIVFLAFSLVVAIAVSGLIGYLLVRSRFLMKELFRKNEALLEQRSVEADDPEKQMPHGFDDKLWQLFRDIDSAVDRQQLYRDRNLNISALSRKFASNDTYVSKAINTYSRVNFNMYINIYRISAAQKMMTAKGDVPSIQEIGEQCGFNSYTTFVRLFKQHTGLTPSQYLAQAKSDSFLG